MIGASHKTLAVPKTKRAVPKTKRKCFVHVGTHKTGTTSIQTFLRNNRSVLAEHGVLIPLAGRSDNNAGHHNLSQQLMALRGFDSQRGGLTELTVELRGSRAETACISCEDFSLLSRETAALVRLRDAIEAGGFTPVILVYLRPQLSYLVSVYAEIVKNGHRISFGAYSRDIIKNGSFLWNAMPGPPFRYDELLARFAAVFGVNGIVVRRYRGGISNKSLPASIAKLLSGKAIRGGLLVYPSSRLNSSATFNGVLRELGVELEHEGLRFAPLNIALTLRLTVFFMRSNLNVARAYGSWIPPCEFVDMIRALPFRYTVRWTRALQLARRSMENLDTEYSRLRSALNAKR